MAKTIELYYENAYLSEFDARVLSCEEGKNGNFFVVLDRTAFFRSRADRARMSGYLRILKVQTSGCSTRRSVME